MKRNEVTHKLILILLGISIVFSSCFNIDEKRTTISVTDPVRHYPPIQFGQKLEVIYTIQNTGNEPLFIKDIQTSGGCEISEKTNIKVLPTGDKGYIHVLYDSKKNIGYAKNYVTIYANFKAGEQEELTFDLNVVPNSLYIKDYEEVYKDKDQILIDGSADLHESERKYTTD